MDETARQKLLERSRKVSEDMRATIEKVEKMLAASQAVQNKQGVSNAELAQIFMKKLSSAQQAQLQRGMDDEMRQIQTEIKEAANAEVARNPELYGVTASVTGAAQGARKLMKRFV